MEERRSQLGGKILDITLEIICLVTGENCSVVKTSGEVVAPCGIGNRTTALPMPLAVYEKDKKILELTNKIIELLTREEYLKEREGPYKDNKMNDLQPLTSLDSLLGGSQDTISPLSDCMNEEYGIGTGSPMAKFPSTEKIEVTHASEEIAEAPTSYEEEDLHQCNITAPSDIKEIAL